MSAGRAQKKACIVVSSELGPILKLKPTLYKVLWSVFTGFRCTTKHHSPTRMTELFLYPPQVMTTTAVTGTTAAEWKKLWNKAFYCESIVNQSVAFSTYQEEN